MINKSSVVEGHVIASTVVEINPESVVGVAVPTNVGCSESQT